MMDQGNFYGAPGGGWVPIGGGDAMVNLDQYTPPHPSIDVPQSLPPPEFAPRQVMGTPGGAAQFATAEQQGIEFTPGHAPVEHSWWLTENPTLLAAKEVAKDLAGPLGGTVQNQVPFLQSLDALTGFGGEEAARLGVDVGFPTTPVEVGVEAIPGVGFGPDALRAARTAARAVDPYAVRQGIENVVRTGMPQTQLGDMTLSAGLPPIRDMGDELADAIPPPGAATPAPLASVAPEPAPPTGATQQSLPPAQAAAPPPPTGGLPPAGPPPAGGLPPVGEPVIPSRLPSTTQLRTVQEIADDAEQAATRFTGTIAGKASQLPVIRTVVDAINPAALTGAPPQALVDELGQEGAVKLQADLLAHTRKLDQGNALVAAIEDGLRQRARAVGFEVADGRVTNVPGAPAVGDLFESPSKYQLTPEQRGLVNEVQRILNDTNVMEKAAGVKKNELFSGEGRYFPRRVRESGGVQNLRPGVRRMTGAKQSFQKERFYEFMEQGMANGVRYEDDIAALVGTRIRAGIKAAADQEVATLLKPFGTTGPQTVGQVGTAIPALAGTSFDMATAKRVISTLGTRYPSSLERATTAVNNILRPLNAVGDLGYFTLQGAATAFNNPTAFAKAIGTAFDAIIMDGRGYGRYISNNSEQIERFTSAGMLMRGSDFSFQQAASGGKLNLLFSKGPGGRLGAAFDNAMNVAALENAKAMAGVSQLAGPGPLRNAMRTVFGDISGQTDDAVAASIANKMTGRLSSQNLGVSGGQRAFESNVAFAPNYYRAALGLVADSLQGGMRGAEARRTMTMLVGGAAATYYGVASAMGQEPNFDPFNSKFMSVKVGDNYIGIGGPLHGFVRLVAESAQNPTKLDDFNMSNPAVRWARGRLSPLAGLAIDIGSQQSYLGSFEGTKDVQSLEDIVQHIATRALPFSAQAAVRGEGATQAAATFMGLRAFPVSEGEQLRDARSDALSNPDLLSRFSPAVAEQIGGLEYNQLGPREREIVNDFLRETDPKVLEQYEKNAQPNVFSQARETIKTATESYNTDLDQLWDGLLNGKADAQAVRAEVDTIKDKIQGVRDAQYGSDEYKKAVEGLPDTEIDYWLAKWNSIYEMSKEGGVINWDAVGARQKVLLEHLAEKDRGMANRLAFNVKDEMNTDQHKLLALYEKAKPTLDAYYAVDPDKRDDWRRSHPTEDYQLWLLGYVGTVRSDAAAQLATSNTTGRTVRLVR